MIQPLPPNILSFSIFMFVFGPYLFISFSCIIIKYFCACAKPLELPYHPHWYQFCFFFLFWIITIDASWSLFAATTWLFIVWNPTCFRVTLFTLSSKLIFFRILHMFHLLHFILVVVFIQHHRTVDPFFIVILIDLSLLSGEYWI